MLNNLIPVEWSNQRVLTTAQLAEVYECNPKNIKVNFGNAKEQFVEGVHYFKLTGEALRQFKGQVKGIDLPISTFASQSLPLDLPRVRAPLQDAQYSQSLGNVRRTGESLLREQCSHVARARRS